MEYSRECRRKQRGSLRKMQSELMNKILVADLLIYTLHATYYLQTGSQSHCDITHAPHSYQPSCSVFSVFKGCRRLPEKINVSGPTSASTPLILNKPRRVRDFIVKSCYVSNSFQKDPGASRDYFLTSGHNHKLINSVRWSQ